MSCSAQNLHEGCNSLSYSQLRNISWTILSPFVNNHNDIQTESPLYWAMFCHLSCILFATQVLRDEVKVLLFTKDVRVSTGLGIETWVELFNLPSWHLRRICLATQVQVSRCKCFTSVSGCVGPNVTCNSCRKTNKWSLMQDFARRQSVHGLGKW